MDQVRQASAIPYRTQHGVLQFLLITSQKGNWIFPKGIIDPGETPEETALKETWEEAGVGGKIAGPPVGFYTYQKLGSECAVSVYLLEVNREDEVWPECGERRRGWFPFEEAMEIVKGKVLRGLLERALSILTL